MMFSGGMRQTKRLRQEGKRDQPFALAFQLEQRPGEIPEI